MQRYRGIPVFGAVLRVHIDEQGDLTSVNGALVPVRNLSMTRTIGARQAARPRRGAVRAQPPGARTARRSSTRGLKAVSSKLVVYRHGLIQGVDKGRTELAYQVEVTNRKNIRDVLYISANGGKVVNRYSLIDNALHRDPLRGRAQAERQHPVSRRSGKRATLRNKLQDRRPGRTWS